jgi:hypothetical protein
MSEFKDNHRYFSAEWILVNLLTKLALLMDWRRGVPINSKTQHIFHFNFPWFFPRFISKDSPIDVGSKLLRINFWSRFTIWKLIWWYFHRFFSSFSDWPAISFIWNDWSVDWWNAMRWKILNGKWIVKRGDGLGWIVGIKHRDSLK